MVKYYEKTKSKYSEILITWLRLTKRIMDKESLNKGERIISAKKPEGMSLIDVTIFHLDEEYNLYEKIVSKKVNIKENIWELKDVTILKNTGGILKDRKFDNYKISSIYNFEKINSLFKTSILCLFRSFNKLKL